MNYIIELPFSDDFNVVLVCVDRFTKMTHFCPITINITAEDIIQLYFQYIFKYHELSDDIISDHGSQFISRFAIRLLHLCKIYNNKSIIFHSQSDDQIE